MLFAIHCLDKPESLDLRLANREAHLAYVGRFRDRIVLGGPLLADDGQTMRGSLLVMEFDDKAAAEAFAAADPYRLAGLFAQVTITGLRKVLP